jgi:hypothetical protein
MAIELEAPFKKVITRSGRKSADLEHALQQIRDWRSWVTENLSYARAPRGRNGLGLKDINPRFFGYVVIGRRKDFSAAFDSMRGQILRDEHIQIRSWDGIVDWARKRAVMFAAHLATLGVRTSSQSGA